MAADTVCVPVVVRIDDEAGLCAALVALEQELAAEREFTAGRLSAVRRSTLIAQRDALIERHVRVEIVDR